MNSENSVLFHYQYINSAIKATMPGFLAFFGKGGMDKTIFAPSSTRVNVDIQLNDKLTMAKMVRRGLSSHSIDGSMDNADIWENREMSFGLIESEATLSSAQIDDRLAGEIPVMNAMTGAPYTRQERMQMLALKVQMYEAAKIFRTNAFLAREAILTGKHPKIIGSTKTADIYDFQRPADSIINLTGKEWNGSSSTIHADIEASCDRVYSRGNRMPEVLIAGQGMMQALLNDAETKSTADNRRYDLVRVSQNNPVPEKYNRLREAGFTPYGSLKTKNGYELWLFTFIHNFTDLSGNAQKFMPTDQVLIASFEGKTSRYFGPEDKIPMTPMMAEFQSQILGFSVTSPPVPMDLKMLDGAMFDPRSCYVDVRPVDNQKAYIYRAQQSPIYAPEEIGVYETLTNGLE